MTTPPTRYHCTFDKSVRCMKPATMVAHGRGYGSGHDERDERLYPRCKFHASIDAGRKYSALVVEPLEGAILLKLERQREEENLRRSERAAEQAKEAAKRTALARTRAFAEDAVKIEVTRDDRTGDIDWDATMKSRAENPEDPTILGPSIPRWTAPRADGYSQHEVEFSQRGDFPLVLKVRVSSEITPNEAKALIVMLQAALQEAGR